MRWYERRKALGHALAKLSYMNALAKEAQKEYDAAAAALARYTNGNPVMVARLAK